ncbi:9574_t:CDS:2 [Ambispora leptoticha]|uniref:9574_t:CDS:1 n=1 Tax=Ambispora leptoticha TaxID=144679 RepID=A0A9N9CQI2_9GLOM|nr:9574_t:CDS:2 [Ambispora leptoticha]
MQKHPSIGSITRPVKPLQNYELAETSQNDGGGEAGKYMNECRTKDGLSLLFANSDAPAYIVHINCLGGFGDNMKNRKISKAFANFLTEKTRAPSNRGYLFFNDPGYANVALPQKKFC